MGSDQDNGAVSAAPFRSVLIRLARDPGQWPFPHVCDVPESEIGNYAVAGWRLASAEIAQDQPAPQAVAAPLPVSDAAVPAEPKKRGRPRKVA